MVSIQTTALVVKIAYVCVNVCMYVCMSVCMYVCVCMHIRMYNVDNRWCVQFEYVVNRIRVMLSLHRVATMTVQLRRFDRGGLCQFL